MLGHLHELVLKGKLYLESGFLALVEEILVRREIVHARLDEEGGDLRNGEHLVTAARKVLNDLHSAVVLPAQGPPVRTIFFIVFSAIV